MNANANANATQLFLAAWEAAGKPPVKKLTYPEFGGGTDKVLSSHSDIRRWAETENATFSDNGEDVKLGWTYGAGNSLTESGGYAELYFDRVNPIRVGRTVESD